MARVQITNRQAASALAKFSLNPSIVDVVLAKLPDTMDRAAAEEHARRISLSAYLCIEVGLTAEDDAVLFKHEVWQANLTKLLEVHDTTELPEVEP